MKVDKAEFISPRPKVWHEIHQVLDEYWKNSLEMKGEAPPVPLILAGWNFSSDEEKKERWQNTVKWAENMNCTHLVKKLEDGEKYFG